MSLYNSSLGDAYKPLLSRRVDVAGVQLFDVELPPRVSGVEPSTGSLAGGAALTITGLGFGSDLAAVRVTVAGTPCEVNLLTTTAVHCKMTQREPDAAVAAPYPSDRGARWVIDTDDGDSATLRIVDEFSVQLTSVDGWPSQTTRLQARIAKSSTIPSHTHASCLLLTLALAPARGGSSLR